MTVYAIVNPSDPYWIEGPLEACAAAVLIVGNGKFSLEDEHAKSVLPIFIFATEEEIDLFWTKSFNRKFKEYLDIPESVKEIREALFTVEIGLISERPGYLSKLAVIPSDQQEIWKKEWQNQYQTSTRDLRKRAHETAKFLTQEK